MLNRFIVANLLTLSLVITAHNAQLELLTHIASNESCRYTIGLDSAICQNIDDIIYGKSCHIDPKLLAPLLLRQQKMLLNDNGSLHRRQIHNYNVSATNFRWIPRATVATFAISCARQCYKTYATESNRPDTLLDHTSAALTNIWTAFLHSSIAFLATGTIMVIKTDLEKYSQADIELLQNKITQTQQMCRQLEELIKKQTAKE